MYYSHPHKILYTDHSNTAERCSSLSQLPNGVQIYRDWNYSANRRSSIVTYSTDNLYKFFWMVKLKNILTWNQERRQGKDEIQTGKQTQLLSTTLQLTWNIPAKFMWIELFWTSIAEYSSQAEKSLTISSKKRIPQILWNFLPSKLLSNIQQKNGVH